MREVVVVQVGQCGCRIGERFWQVVCDEHCLDPCGNFCSTSHYARQHLDVYFSEAPCQKFVPRTLFIDPDLRQMSLNRNDLFAPESFLCDETVTGKKEVVERLRKLTENCESLQSFQVAHSLAGGLGSGLGSLLFTHLKQEYPKQVINTFSALPTGKKASESVLEVLNAGLGLPALITATDLTLCFDNEALYQICTRTLECSAPTAVDLNHLISLTMSGLTACSRYPCQIPIDLKNFQITMVPHPRLHFFIPGFAPLNPMSQRRFRMPSVPEIVRQMFDERNKMLSCDLTTEKYLAVAAIFRGPVAIREPDSLMHAYCHQNPRRFSESFPCNFNIAICDIPPPRMNLAATFFCNSTAICQLLGRLSQHFSRMWRKRAYLHWYTAEGVEEAEFEAAEASMQELISDYRHYDGVNESFQCK